jgi:hypothetical protein
LELSAGRLDADTAIRLERHAAGCPSCHELLSSQRLVWDALDGFPAAPPVSPSFDDRLYARIALEQQDGWLVRTWRRIFEAGRPVNWKPMVSMAAACAVLVTAVLVRQPETISGKPAPVTVAFDQSEIESIERALEDFEMLHAVGTPAEVVADAGGADAGRETKL